MTGLSDHLETALRRTVATESSQLSTKPVVALRLCHPAGFVALVVRLNGNGDDADQWSKIVRIGSKQPFENLFSFHCQTSN